ncbi:MAG TPA: L-seryl-tRNA(Sec) selenium transferase, partial [Desulfuromonadales bacterium]|nr:L-seryl-tRNA(Sec) selenium transferase [Desulfuromonadales bacterium]
LAALEATLRLYRDEREAVAEIPTLRMLTAEPEVLKAKAASYLRRIRPKIPSSVTVAIIAGHSQVGGGSLPLLDLPTLLIAVMVEGRSPRQIDDSFRQGKTPVLGRINKGRYLLDLRTLQDADIPAVIEAMNLIGQADNLEFL